MKLRYPSYFHQFSCIAAACPDSCCKEWDVLVDREAAAIYRALPGDLGEDLRRCLYQEDGEWYFSITEGRCPMWRRDGLCRIQAQLGHDALCKTCRDFPRLTHDYGDFVERGLELSCPEAAKFILQGNTGWLEEEIPGGEMPEYEAADMEILLRCREVMLTILADQHYSVPEALALALLYGYRAQNELDGGEPADWMPAEELAFGRSVAKIGACREIADFYAGLEILNAGWAERLASPCGGGEWDERLRKMAIYGMERYFLQAISDFDLVGRVKMVVLSCILVWYLGGELLETAQSYAKEIENNDDNVEAVLDGAYTHPALTDDRILGILLEATL